MLEIRVLCDALFPAGHDVRADGELVHGTGRTAEGPVAVVGTCDHAAIGVDLAFALADAVLKVVREHPGRPILMLVDTQGQRLSRRDELLGNGGFLAHLAKCFEVARRRGHLLLTLVHGEAVSGGFLALGMHTWHGTGERSRAAPANPGEAGQSRAPSACHGTYPVLSSGNRHPRRPCIGSRFLPRRHERLRCRPAQWRPP